MPKTNRMTRGTAKRRASLATLGATLFMAACAGGAPAGPLPPSDPAQLHFASELGIDLADFQLTASGGEGGGERGGVGRRGRAVIAVGSNYVGRLPECTACGGERPGHRCQCRLGGNEVMRGWNGGIRGMRIGGRRRLVVRPGLAYGSRGRGKVPPGATLVFEVQLIDAN